MLSETANGLGLGLTICYDVRFPELYRILAVRGAEIVTVPAAFTFATTRDHWEVLLRARAIEGQAFVVAANQIGEHAPGHPLRRALDDRRPVGRRARDRARHARPSSSPSSTSSARPRSAARCPRWPTGVPRRTAGRPRCRPSGAPSRPSTSGGSSSTRRSASSRARASTPAASRTSPTRPASPTGSSTTTSSPRTRSWTRCSSSAGTSCWRRSARPTRQDVPAEQKLTAIAGFIIESYRHDPDLMKVIIVEVTRAANTFGATHIGKIGEAYALIRGVVEKAQKTGEFRSEIPAEFAVMAFYGAIEQVLTGWIFGLLAGGRRRSTSWPRSHIVRTIVRRARRIDSARHDRQRSRQAPGLVRPARRHRCPGLDRDHPHCSCGFPPHLWGRSARVKDDDPQRTQEWDPRFDDEQRRAARARPPSRPRPPRARPPRGHAGRRGPRGGRAGRARGRRGPRRRAAQGAARDRRPARRGGDGEGAQEASRRPRARRRSSRARSARRARRPSRPRPRPSAPASRPRPPSACARETGAAEADGRPSPAPT